MGTMRRILGCLLALVAAVYIVAGSQVAVSGSIVNGSQIVVPAQIVSGTEILVPAQVVNGAYVLVPALASGAHTFVAPLATIVNGVLV